MSKSVLRDYVDESKPDTLLKSLINICCIYYCSILLFDYYLVITKSELAIHWNNQMEAAHCPPGIRANKGNANTYSLHIRNSTWNVYPDYR